MSHINRVLKGGVAHVSTPPPTPRRQPQSQSHHIADADVKPRNLFEEALMKITPDYRKYFHTDDQIDAYYGVQGRPAEERAAVRRAHDERVNKHTAATGGVVLACGLKPVRGEQVHVIDIPGSALKIRLWDGGQVDHGLFLLDFVVTEADGTLKAVNSDGQFTIYAIHRPGMPCSTGRLQSWEEAAGWQNKDINPGEERFSVPEGTYCRLKCPAQPAFNFGFQVPVRERPDLLAALGPIGQPSTFANP
ncbi:hypothetical protein EVG20_g8044 [Dentipellis fragilis]|uniref:Uncharacterized protein n=1 Tax=Dentipellis fragilis TaxID=205917 RepID=A0A4Y9YCW9_9AGAM|nr:hypothetical protein EVG20_g8044 [Dentipellis fragilis]